MNYEEKYEPEIDLKNLLFHILYKWRSIILAGIIFSILLAGYQVIRRESSFAGASFNNEAEDSQMLKEYEIALAEYELTKLSYEQDIQYYEELLAHQQTYMEESALMKINPYQEAVVSADFFVRLENAEWEILPNNINIDPTDSLLKYYTSNFMAGLDWAQIERAADLEEVYLKELLSISTDYTSNTFTVTVVHSDMKMAQRILEIITAQVMEKYLDTDDAATKHTITVLNQTATNVISKSLADTQKTNRDAIADYQLKILDYEKSLIELEEPEAVTTAEDSKEARKWFDRKTLKYAILGFAMGIFLIAAFYGAFYLFDGKLHNEKELKDRYGYQLLGALPQRERNGLLAGIDRFLERLEGTDRRMPEEEVYQRISVNIANLAGERKHVLLTGTIDLNRLQELASAIGSHLENINLTVAADMNQNTNTLIMLAECDAVILAEERNHSRSLEIQKEQENIMALDKPVIGYVLL